jgi:nuclear transport factor 2 (NTF2) superfamily protein
VGYVRIAEIFRLGKEEGDGGETTLHVVDVLTDRPPLPPFTLATAVQKVQVAEDAWNTRNPDRVAESYTFDSVWVWRNRDSFLTGREEIVAFLAAKWARELDYSLRIYLWAFQENRIAVRFKYECHDAEGQWYHRYGNELWEFDERGLMRRQEASINDFRIEESQRRIFWPRPVPEHKPELPLQ